MDGILANGFMALSGEFVIKDGEYIRTYDKVADIPDEFDHVIKFNPTPPPSPHSINDHIEMGKYGEYLQQLMKRERK
jgi:hypothetical protein